MSQRIFNEDPYPDLFDKRMSAKDIRRYGQMSRSSFEHHQKRLMCPQCETWYIGGGHRNMCMRWHRGEVL